MPKICEATRAKMRSISMRKPLRDISNARTTKKPANFPKKTDQESEELTEDRSLDHLFLVQSDISTLVRQIDELVVQALQLTSKKGMKEIKQFEDFLSEMQTSLKTWATRFQKAVSHQSIIPRSKLKPPTERAEACVTGKNTNASTESPEKTKWESFVSPSPLVSWRAECNTEGGRQLFLLTPLPQTKSFSSKCQALSVPTLEQARPTESSHPVTPFKSVENLRYNHYESDLAGQTLSNLKNVCPSPAKFSETNHSTFALTPHLKTSPPKTCVLLEPLSEFCEKKNQGIHISTSLRVGVQNSSESQGSESSNSQSSNDLALEYPDLFGISLAHNLGRRKNVIEDSPNWIVSPPKTCAILEPSDDEVLSAVLTGKCSIQETSPVHNQLAELYHIATNDYHQQGTCLRFDITESTPMINEPTSTFQMGKRPGETTLKKELWTKFEAACTHNSSTVQEMSPHKRFLDRLEEASD
ncbi:hypothetical protein F511_08144 [Dorcoceras hygrometricum]|uniref:Uncharacterized protein n=1 Tax=Dorcoceras hygrometricum TaxID=472368 RepID=A0A2Z7B045_9LAMI|nr:hypothetical protein F511_08144 [Dorcoceras hygrometricum]